MSTNVAGDVSVIFTAETAQFTASVAKINTAVTASARQMEAASARLQKAWNRELIAQDRLAQKQEESARAKEMAALKADILARSEVQVAEVATRTELSYTKLIQTMTNAGSISDNLADSNRALAVSQEQVASSSGHMTSRLYATQGAAALLEGKLPLRALDRFAAGIGALGPILDAAFPIIGVLALVDVLVHAGKKAYDFEQNVVSLRDAIESLNDVQITVDKKLGTAADSIEEQVERVLEKTQGKTASLQQKYSYHSQKPIDLSDYFYDQKYKDLPDDVKANYETLYKSIAPADLPDRLAKIRKELVDLHEAAASSKASNYTIAYPVSGYGPDATRDPKAYYDARITAASQLKAQLQSASDLQGAQGQGLQMDITDQQQKDRDDAQRKAEEVARKGAAAFRKSSEDQHKAMESQLSGLKNDHQVTTVEEYNFWAGMLSAAKSYPDNLAKVRERMGELYQEMGRELEAYGKKYDEENQRRLAKQKQGDAEANRLADEMDAQQRRSADFTSKLQAVTEGNDLALRETIVSHDLATAAITRHDAALQQASLHAAGYTARLEDLRREKESDDNDSSLPQDQRDANQKQRDIESAKIQGEAGRSALQDYWAIQQQTAVGGFLEALQELSAAGKDTAAQFKSITSELLNGVNRTLIQEITSPNSGSRRNLWKNLGKDVSTSVAGDALQAGESSLLDGVGMTGIHPKLASLLGLGSSQKLGTASNPMFVRSADTVVAKGIGDAAKLVGLTGAKSTSDGGGGFFSDLIKALPGFADGVTDFGGGLAMVGERGPEVVNLPTGSSVIPNGGHRVSKMGGDTHHHTVNVDARGSNDPAAVRAAAKQGAMEGHMAMINPTARLARAMITDKSRRRAGSHRSF